MVVAVVVAVVAVVGRARERVIAGQPRSFISSNTMRNHTNTVTDSLTDS